MLVRADDHITALHPGGDGRYRRPGRVSAQGAPPTVRGGAGRGRPDPRSLVLGGRQCCSSLDELGYLELDRRGAELLFQVFTERE
jgi:hypothetical protein